VLFRSGAVSTEGNPESFGHIGASRRNVKGGLPAGAGLESQLDYASFQKLPVIGPVGMRMINHYALEQRKDHNQGERAREQYGDSPE